MRAAIIDFLKEKILSPGATDDEVIKFVKATEDKP
jgi:hypothetical protein